MPAERQQVVRGAFDGAEQVERGDAAPGPLGLVVALAEQDGRAVEAVGHPRRDDADDALVPLGRREHQRRRQRSGTMASAASSIAASIVWRSRLSSLSLSASGSAASRSALPSSSSAMDASSRRPAALSLGPRRKPTVPASAAPGRPPATSSSAASPGRGALRSRPRPIVVSTRFSSTRGTTSAMVPTATRSVYGRRASGRSTSGSPGSSRSACASLKATPTPARWRQGYDPSLG